ncbi:Protein-disulfide isomerase [Sphingomonas guangdongensis]|uniref:Protein-disulfide isomerase n=1 Tax=Sphingomonas guangdongensis TaxID=1141890 RepID=A0A285QDD3_9SPHN|nr:DsbA family protein [Sphingomonas guangdongensis]SOB79836.1 Protein-disulfide isomerase [Sphingomonas guangdongensis]
MTLRPWVLALLLIAAGAAGGGVAAAVQAWRAPAAGGDVRAFLLAHPDVIPEAMQRLQERESGKAIAANRPAVEQPFAGAVGGNPAGDVTIVTYMDYACGYCRSSLPDLASVVKDDGKVRIVYRELPILSADSRTAAQWALAAAEQGKYLPFHEALFAAGRPTPAAVAAAAQAAGLDLARARRVAASPQVAAELGKNLQTAGALGMTGTPAWVIGDRILSGAVGAAALRDAVAAARAA